MTQFLVQELLRTRPCPACHEPHSSLQTLPAWNQFSMASPALISSQSKVVWRPVILHTEFPGNLPSVSWILTDGLVGGVSKVFSTQ